MSTEQSQKIAIFVADNHGHFSKCSGYKFFTKLDDSMQYYMFELDNKSQDSCTIITQFDKHKYLRLPMGLKDSPDIAEAIREMYYQKIDEEII
jgi:hypothetical protein